MSDRPDDSALPQWSDYGAPQGGANAAGAAGQARNSCAEAYRLLFLSLAQGYLSTFVDPDCPDFVPAVNSSVFNASSTNPDYIYYQASIDGRGVYRMAGVRGAALFVHVDLAAGGTGVMDELGPSTGGFDLDGLSLGTRGEFEVVLSEERPADCAGDWRRLDPATRVIVVRQGAYEWDAAPDGRFAIERIDRPLAAHRFTANRDRCATAAPDCASGALRRDVDEARGPAASSRAHQPL